MSRLNRLLVEIHRRSLWQVLLIYSGGALLAYQAVQALTEGLGLPPWFPAFAVVLFIVGLPIVVATAFVHEVAPPAVAAPEAEPEIVQAEAATARREARRRHRFLTWRNAVASFVVALAVWGVVATGWMLFGGRPAPVEASLSELLAVERDKPAVAVLPFANLSGREEDRYFADGFHEDVLNQLAKIASIDVLARQAVLRYRDSDKGPREIGRELSATAILEGSVRREGDQVRITAQLIDAADEAHLWSEQYDEDLSATSIFSIQSGIAQQVARAIGAVLTPEEESRVLYPETQSLTAYDLYLRARAVGQGELDERIRLLRLSIDADPEFAPAWGELGWRYGGAVWSLGWDIAWADSALAIAQRAIELAADQPDGYRALTYAYYATWRIRAMERASRKIVELAPSDAFGIQLLAYSLQLLGSLPEAVEWNKRGIALYPADVDTRDNLADVYVLLGLPDRAEEQLRVLSVLDPSVSHDIRADLRLLDGDRDAALELASRSTQRATAWRYLDASRMAAMAGDYNLALAWAEEAANLSEGGITTRYGGGLRALPLRLGFALMVTGNEEEGRRRLEQSLELLGDFIDAGADDSSLFWDLAATYAALGRRALAVEWAQKAIDAGYKYNPRFIELDPVFESLRGDPEFERIIARIRADQEEMARRVVEQERVDRAP